jgi:hypothetical protein
LTKGTVIIKLTVWKSPIGRSLIIREASTFLKQVYRKKLQLTGYSYY